MVDFRIEQHTEIDEGYQGFNLTKFSFTPEKNISDDHVVDKFLQSQSFRYHSLRDAIKREPNKGYLGRPFDLEKIKISDFRKLDKNSIRGFLIDFLNEPDWGDDREDFRKLLNRYFKFHELMCAHQFYLLSKDWFDEKDEKLAEPGYSFYIYYFLIIYIDSDAQTLISTEWTYD